MAISDPVSTATLLADFISVVKSPVMSPASSWHAANPPYPAGGPHWMLGPQAEPDPAFPINVGDITTTNIFYILHGFALKLTRHRRGRAWVRTNSGANDLGFALTSYFVGNIIWFDYPAIPPVGTPFSAATMNTFLVALRTQVQAIKADNFKASEIVSCHISCHGSCHGSRGRR